jgi:hypothetical protein
MAAAPEVATAPACDPTLIPETAGIPAEVWIVFFSIVAISAIVTYGLQEKANRWHAKGYVGQKAAMWAEIAAIPVCCALGWYTVYQGEYDYMPRPWAGLLAGFLGSMASPWFLSILGRVISRKLGKSEDKDEVVLDKLTPKPPADAHSTSRPGTSATPENMDS